MSILTPRPTRTDSTNMKMYAKQSLTKDTHEVAVFYHNTGFAQWIVRHLRFEQVALLVIALNALWMWVDTDLNPGKALISSPPLFQLVEHFFCMFFSYEWTMRFLAFRIKRDGLRDFWFVFDSLLVASMVFETWIMSIVVLATNSGGGGMGNASILRLARLLRLTRMGRMARLLRALPELMILIKGMVAAVRSVIFSLGLLLLILYVFGIAFTQLCEDTALEPEFATVMTSMHTLLIHGALMDDVSSVIRNIETNSIPVLLLFYVFVLLAALTCMNMLIGVICEMVMKVGETEREASTLSFVTENIEELLISTEADENHDNLISKDEFKIMFSNKTAVSILDKVGVDVVGLVDFVDIIFEAGDSDGGEKRLTFGELMGVILDLRNTKTARVSDLVMLRKHMNQCFKRLERQLMDMDCSARYHTAKNGLQEEALSGRISAIGEHWSKWGIDVQASKAQRPGQYHPSGVTTVAMCQDIITGSLRDLQASQERELAVLHAKNLELLDRLADKGKAAGTSLASVLEVVASMGTAVTATAGPQPVTSPSTQGQMPLQHPPRDNSSISTGKVTTAPVANAAPAPHDGTVAPTLSKGRGQMSEAR